MSWDRRTTRQQARTRTAALKSQVVDAVAPFSPYWRERLAALGRSPADVASVAGLRTLPAAGERDICQDGPADAAALVLQAGESGWALHTEGPALRRGLARRLFRPRSYRGIVEADTRPTTFVSAGLGLRFPVASTRSDLDVVARTGARLWQVLGLTRADVLVAALPLTPTAALQGLQLGALGAGSPALFPGDSPDDVAAALRLVPASVLALPTGSAGELLDDLDESGADLSAVRTVLLVGAPDDAERAAVLAGLERAAVSGAAVLAVHVPEGHRLLWAECREGGPGLHTYPDLELIELLDAETAMPADDGEVVLTQLGLRGTALLRWRTGDVASALETAACPACGRTVPRLTGVRRGPLVRSLALRGGRRDVDLRAVAAALDGRADVKDWRVVAGPSPRDGADELLIHVVATGEPADVAVAVARDVRTASGLLPTQVVLVATSADLPRGRGPSRRVLLRERAQPAAQG